MEVGNGLKFSDIKQLVGEHLKTALNIDEFVITYAKHDKNTWQVNVQYWERVGDDVFPTVALLALDDLTGDVTVFKTGREWGF